jgi:hypothetical protein
MKKLTNKSQLLFIFCKFLDVDSSNYLYKTLQNTINNDTILYNTERFINFVYYRWFHQMYQYENILKRPWHRSYKYIYEWTIKSQMNGWLRKNPEKIDIHRFSLLNQIKMSGGFSNECECLYHNFILISHNNSPYIFSKIKILNKVHISHESFDTWTWIQNELLIGSMDIIAE